MKETHKDISLLLAPPKPLEVKNHEERIANEAEAMEVIDEEREERLERVRRRALEWQTNYFCRGIILEVVKTSIVEATGLHGASDGRDGGRREGVQAEDVQTDHYGVCGLFKLAVTGGQKTSQRD